jgi:hypothetical protein
MTMKHAVLLSALLVATSLLSFAEKNEQSEDFLLQVHIVRVDMAQGQTGVHVSNGYGGGGRSFLYNLYIVHIDGDPHRATVGDGFSTPRVVGEGNVMILKRGNTYHCKFQHEGRMIWRSTGQTSATKARQFPLPFAPLAVVPASTLPRRARAQDFRNTGGLKSTQPLVLRVRRLCCGVLSSRCSRCVPQRIRLRVNSRGQLSGSTFDQRCIEIDFSASGVNRSSPRFESVHFDRNRMIARR